MWQCALLHIFSKRKECKNGRANIIFEVLIWKEIKRIYLIVKCMFLAAINTRTTKWILYQPHFKSKYLNILAVYYLINKKNCVLFLSMINFELLLDKKISFKPNYFPESLSVVIQTRIIHLELTWGINYLIFCGDHMLLQFRSQ